LDWTKLALTALNWTTHNTHYIKYIPNRTTDGRRKNNMADKNNHFDDYRELSPEKLHNLVHCFVQIILSEGEKLQGWVYTIDPVSHTIVIAKDDDENDDERHASDTRSIVFVMSKAVKDLRILETTRKEPEWLKNFAVKEQQNFTDDELQKRKANLIEWLNKNRVPILDSSTETKVVEVLGGLVIEPPYDVDSCKGTNEIVLERIRKLISSMPDG
jgi:gem associated protein 6